MTPALELRGIHKSYGSVHAVRGADFTLRPGEVHVLLGENGAGKSTLMHIAGGMAAPDRGEILVNGMTTILRSPRDARQLGIGMVHQHFTSVPAFTVRENVALSSDWSLGAGALNRRIRQLDEQLGFSLDPLDKAGTLPVAALQRLEILKVLAGNATMLILDEPTGSLAPADGEELLTLVRRLVDQGSAAVLITHKLDEALRFGDRVTVLRRGSVVLSGPLGGRAASDLALAMLGESLADPGGPVAARLGPVVVAAEAVSVRPFAGKGPGISGATFEIRAGETVGLAAIEGNGERELLRAVAGLTPIAGGALRVERPISLVPEDRTIEGLIAEFSLVDNLTLGLGQSAPWIHRGLIDRSAARDAATHLIEEHEIVAPGPDVPAGALSGGNQQRLILARALERHPRVLVAENPGRGLDIRASRASFERLRTAAREGAGVLVYSSDLDELIEWCDRVIIVAQGKVHLPPSQADRETLGRLMLVAPK